MSLSALFAQHTTLRPVIESVLEGRLGRVVAHGNPPRVARLDLGCYAIFGGDGSCEPAGELLRAVVPPRELLLPDDQAWRDRLDAIHGTRVEDRPMRTFSPHALTREHLQCTRARLPAGMTIERFTEALTVQLDDSITPHAMQVFPDAASFIRDGVGFAVLDGIELASAATSYSAATTRVEVAIATRESHRGRGLATAAASALLLDCLERGLRPEWSAANPVSKRLALSLGYRPAEFCDIFFLRE